MCPVPTFAVDERRSPLADCPAQQDIEDSRAVAAHLGPITKSNFINEYSEHVVEYLVEGYKTASPPTLT